MVERFGKRLSRALARERIAASQPAAAEAVSST
jgi:hypothetical protein